MGNVVVIQPQHSLLGLRYVEQYYSLATNAVRFVTLIVPGNKSLHLSPPTHSTITLIITTQPLHNACEVKEQTQTRKERNVTVEYAVNICYCSMLTTHRNCVVTMETKCKVNTP